MEDMWLGSRVRPPKERKGAVWEGQERSERGVCR